MIGKNIAYKRRLIGLTQKELAKKVGLTASAISLIESGKNTPTAENLKNIALALETTVEFLKGDKAKDPILELIDRLRAATEDGKITWEERTNEAGLSYYSDFPTALQPYNIFTGYTGNGCILYFVDEELANSSYSHYTNGLNELYNAIKISVDDKSFIYDHLRALEELEKEEE